MSDAKATPEMLQKLEKLKSPVAISRAAEQLATAIFPLECCGEDLKTLHEEGCELVRRINDLAGRVAETTMS